MKEIGLVFIGGGSGSAVRYLIGLLCKNVFPLIKFPIQTLIANLIACVIFAVILLLSKDKISPNIQLLLLVGFCGGLSTFSAFSFETYTLMTNQIGWAIFNILVSVLCCIGVFYLIR